MKRIRVRFNLSRGKNYMKWKVEYPDKTVSYFDVTESQLILYNCKLKNHKSTAKKIYTGANKSVCAWVLCDSIEIRTENFLHDEGYEKVKYNPKVNPYWTFKDKPADEAVFKKLVSIDYGLYCIEN